MLLELDEANDDMADEDEIDEDTDNGDDDHNDDEEDIVVLGNLIFSLSRHYFINDKYSSTSITIFLVIHWTECLLRSYPSLEKRFLTKIK